jgi:hypothetical protein
MEVPQHANQLFGLLLVQIQCTNVIFTEAMYVWIDTLEIPVVLEGTNH